MTVAKVHDKCQISKQKGKFYVDCYLLRSSAMLRNFKKINKACYPSLRVVRKFTTLAPQPQPVLT